MTFVGFQVSKSGIGMDLAKVAAIMDWPTPKNIKEVQSFLGFSNFYKKFIDHNSTLTSPLTSLTRKGVRFTWSLATDAAFWQLQRAFTSAPILLHFQPYLPITVEANASDFALGCIVSQQNPDGELHLVCCYSRKFTPAELNCPIYDKELLAVVEAFIGGSIGRGQPPLSRSTLIIKTWIISVKPALRPGGMPGGRLL